MICYDSESVLLFPVEGELLYSGINDIRSTINVKVSFNIRFVYNLDNICTMWLVQCFRSLKVVKGSGDIVLILFVLDFLL